MEDRKRLQSDYEKAKQMLNSSKESSKIEEATKKMNEASEAFDKANQKTKDELKEVVEKRFQNFDNLYKKVEEVFESARTFISFLEKGI